jgi:predicted SAM-dependent methyltransferase
MLRSGDWRAQECICVSARRTVHSHTNTSPGNPVNVHPTLTTPGIKLNLGCGFDHRAGYVNVDLNHEHAPDLVSDATRLDAVADSVCAEVLAQDMLEHLPRAKAETALREWNRVLQPQGRLLIRVPSLVHLLKLLSDGHRQGVEQQLELIQCLFGTQAYDGDFHLNGFTEVTLRHLLQQCGFKVQSISLVDEWMFDVLATKQRHERPDPMLLLASDGDFVEQAYLKVLQRPADAEGRAYYVKTLGSGIARETVIATLQSSDEYRALLPKQNA